eukprot:1516190-Pyramimonas_sp.AAC.1
MSCVICSLVVLITDLPVISKPCSAKHLLCPTAALMMVVLTAPALPAALSSTSSNQARGSTD